MRRLDAAPLVALAVLVIAIASSSSASAQSIEVVSEEDPFMTCSVALGNCEAIVEGEAHIAAMPSGVIVSDCSDTYHVVWNHNGTGVIHWGGANESALGCNVTNCTVMSDEWTINSSTEVAVNSVQSSITFCLRSGTTEIECTGNYDIFEITTNHRYFHNTTTLCAGGSRRLELVHASSHRDIDGHYPVELLH